MLNLQYEPTAPVRTFRLEAPAGPMGPDGPCGSVFPVEHELELKLELTPWGSLRS